MPINFSYGKGCGEHYSGTFMKEAQIENGMGKLTINQISNKLAKQYKLTDGQITIYEISFNIQRRKED